MADKVYVVTLKNRDDLEGFYSDMQSDGYKLHMKRPISRNTQYYMSDDQANDLRSDSRVLAVELRPEDIPFLEIGLNGVDIMNNRPFGYAGDFAKSGVNDQYRDWAKLHMSGDAGQRQKGAWGSGTRNDTINVWNDGTHVDVVICDDPVSFDCEEWKALSDNRDRFVTYDWYGELNGWVTSIDDDSQTLPSPPYSNYFTNNTNNQYHGNHVTGTVAGKWYGWAPEANIYNMQVIGNSAGQGTPVNDLLIFDYLRAFHRYKAINPLTGQRNPTVTNHSWGWGSNLTSIFDGTINISDVGSVVYRGTTYSSNNPNPSGWTMAGLEADFGISSGKMKYNYHYAALTADCEDAVEDGIVIIGAAGNADFYMSESEPTHESYVDWNNSVYLQNVGTMYFMRGSSPCNAKGVINVGALDVDKDFTRASFSNYGPRVDVWAPGVHILSAFNNQGYNDGKYGGANYYYPIQGTSMASPQICGIAACLATGKERFTNSDVLGFIQQNGLYDDMTWDQSGGNFADPTCKGSNGGLFFDSPSLEMKAVNPRPETGHMGGWYKDQLKGHRRHEELNKLSAAQLYPRVNALYRPIADALYKTFPITVTASGGQYIFSGDDRNGTISASGNPTININKGDTLQLTINASGHPFWISLTQAIGQPSNANRPVAVTNNGVDSSTITWDTSGELTGTYYYNCEFHPSMTGIIFVN